MTPLDPADYTVVPHVAALDTFRMTNPDGSFVADITEEFIDRLIAHMNDREAATGDLAPLVIGHTKDGQPEIAAPPVVGYARHWHKDVLGTTGRPCAFFDAWIRNDKVDQARDYPRRSCEVWVDRYEVDPISLLGATTPARDLGLLKLSREGSLVVNSPGDMAMPNDKPEDKKDSGAPKPDKKEEGESKADAGILNQILQAITNLTDLITGGGAPAGAAPEGKPGEDKHMSDEELDQLLNSLGGHGGDMPEGPGPGDVSRAGEKPVPNGTGYPGGADTKLQREVDELRISLARRDVLDALKTIAGKGKDVNPDEPGLVEDLVAMPPDMRARQLSRIERDAKPKIGVNGTMSLDAALGSATDGGPKRMTPDDKTRIIKLAREKNISFDAAARDAGFTL